MTNGLKLGTGRATDATKGKDNVTHEDVGKNAERPDAVETASREGATSRPHVADTGLPKPLETKDEVETRLDPTQPVSGDNADAVNAPEETFLDPPTPAETRKDTLEGRDSNEEAEAKLAKEREAIANEPKPETADDGAVRYSSHPIQNYKVGRFEFENGLLVLNEDEDIKEFEKILNDPKFPRSERARINKLDLSAAEAQVRLIRSQSPKASKSIGSEAGDRDPGKQVGKGTLGDPHGE